MRKSDQLREVFREIRRVVGAAVPASDIVRLAHLIVKAYHTEEDNADDYGQPADSRAFSHLPVDEAMKDGGWKVLLFEMSASADTDRLDPSTSELLHREISKYLGPEWQSRFPPG